MSATTYYVALPFVRTDEGDLVPGEAREAQTAAGALREASRLALTHPGAVAFSRTGDPGLGDFADATVLRAFGEVPSVDQLFAW
jgi:hypothetical protein